MSSASRPGEARRNPPPGTPTSALLRPLSDWIRAEAQSFHAERGPYRVLDVGCGVKPYYPWFEPYVSEYVGLDIGGNPNAELHGTIESIPAEDASFDLVLCTQVLEHCDDPAQGVRELRRVMKPGGHVLALDPRREGLPPCPARPLALDARGARAPLPYERHMDEH